LKASAKIPAVGPLCMGVVLTCQLCPPSSERKTRACAAPPVPNHARRPWSVTRHWPAGGEGELTRQCRRHVGGDDVPAVAAVVGGDDAEPSVHWIRQGEPAPAVEERHAVVERVGSVVHEGERPALTGVRRDVDPCVAAVADREDHGVVGVERLDVAELQCRRAGRRHLLPGRAGVDGPQDRAQAAARPRGVRADRGHASKPRSRACRRQVPRVTPSATRAKRAGAGCKRAGATVSAVHAPRVRFVAREVGPTTIAVLALAQAVLWIAARPAGEPLGRYLGQLLGAESILLLSIGLVLISTLPWVEEWFDGIDRAAIWHRRVAITGLVLLLPHVLLSSNPDSTTHGGPLGAIGAIGLVALALWAILPRWRTVVPASPGCRRRSSTESSRRLSAICKTGRGTHVTANCASITSTTRGFGWSYPTPRKHQWQ
jgi:hypothetical protein